MTPTETITAIQSIGLELTANGDRLHLSAGPVAPSPELCQTIRDNKAALLALLAPPPPEPEAAPVPPPAILAPVQAPAPTPAAIVPPAPLSGADRESIAFAIAAFGLDGGTPPPDGAAPVKCADCQHSDTLGQGDAVAGLLLCKVGGRSDWGMKPHPCPSFDPRQAGEVPARPAGDPTEPRRDTAGYCPVCATTQPDGSDLDPRAAGHCRQCWGSRGRAVPLKPLPAPDMCNIAHLPEPTGPAAGKVPEASRHRKGKMVSPLELAQADAAKLFGVSLRGVQWAALVIDRGIHEVDLAVTRGELTLKSAARLVMALDHDCQRAVMELPAGERQKAINGLPISPRLAALGEGCE